MVERLERPLTATERRVLRVGLAANRARRALAPRRHLLATAIVVGPLWLLTFLATRHFLVSTGFWVVVATIISVFVAVQEHRQCNQWRDALEGALEADRAVEDRVQCSEIVEIAERDDEGPAWLLQATTNEVLVLRGQDFYESHRFPSDDFSLSVILGRDGTPLTMLTHIRGNKLARKVVLTSGAVSLLGDERAWQPIAMVPGTLAELVERIGSES